MAGDVHQQLNSVMKKYLGPAGQRFIDRQIKFHLGKKPEDITKEDVRQLSEWIKVSLGLLTDDKKLVDSCTDEVLRISK